MSLVYWDTMLFIYWLEAHPQNGPLVQQIHRKMAQRGAQLCTGVFTVGEVLAAPYKLGKADAIRQLSEYFRGCGVKLLPFDLDAAERYAEIRGKHNVSPADAVHLATASVTQVDLYLTNDKKLKNLSIPGIKFIAGLDGNIF